MGSHVAREERAGFSVRIVLVFGVVIISGGSSTYMNFGVEGKMLGLASEEVQIRRQCNAGLGEGDRF